MKISRSIEIAAAAEKIWPYMVEPEKLSRWCITIRELRYTSEQHSGLHTPFYFEEKAGGILLKMNFVVTEWIVNEIVSHKMTSGNFLKGYEQKYTIGATPAGSQITIFEYVKLPYGIFGQILGLLRRRRSETHLENMLIKLKRLVETGQ